MLSKKLPIYSLAFAVMSLTGSIACSNESSSVEDEKVLVNNDGDTEISVEVSDPEHSGLGDNDDDLEKNAEQLEAVLALEGDAEYGAYLAGDCLTCHAPNQVNGSIPILHGKEKRFLASALLEYKNKQRTSEVMRGVAAGLGNEEIAALILYLNEQ